MSSIEYLIVIYKDPDMEKEYAMMLKTYGDYVLGRKGNV